MSADEEELLRNAALPSPRGGAIAAREQIERALVEAEAALGRKTAELTHSLSLMRTTLEAASDGILITDASGRITDFNEKYLRMWRLARTEVESGHHREVTARVAPQFADAASFLARNEQIDASRPPESFDVLQLADGRTFERFTRIQCVDGRDIGRVWNFRDITAPRRFEEALRDETRILELLQQTGAMLASNLDLHALLQSVTDAATQLSGAQIGAFFYKTVIASNSTRLLYTVSGAPAAAFEKIGRPCATPLFVPVFSGEGPIRCADVTQDPRYGQTSPHYGMPPGHPPVRSYLAVPVISRGGEIIGGLFFGHAQTGVFTERTERIVVGLAAQGAVAIDNARLYEDVKRAAIEREQLLEAERAARAEAERASLMKDEFLANLSHELRTPLNSILGWSTLLSSGKIAGDGIRQGLQTIERNARAQAKLIEDLLDISRIISGKVRLDVQRIDLASVVSAAVDSVRPQAQAKGLRLRSIVDPDAGPVAGDPYRLQQVVWNLLSNAVKFTPKGGTVDALVERADSHLEITVSDSGMGIKPELLPQIFDRLRQADASTTRKFGGLGLGLSIVKQLVELHGGSIQAKSAGENRGATFIVSLPLAPLRVSDLRDHPAGKAVVLSDDEVQLTGVKVLVIDDAPDSRDLVKRVLTQCQAEVMTAASATEGLALLKNHRPDIVVSDIGMPEIDGYQFIREVRSLPAAQGGRTPAIALTAFARSEDRTRAMMSGYQVHIAKPIEPQELIATVGSLSGRMDRPDS